MFFSLLFVYACLWVSVVFTKVVNNACVTSLTFLFPCLIPFIKLCAEEDDADASSPIPLDDGQPIDFAAIEVVQCLIQHHNAIFTDANETVWR